MTDEAWVGRGLLLAAIGGVIAIGKALGEEQPAPLRVIAGRVILGSATSLVAGLLLLQFPDIPTLVLIGAASALGVGGAQAVEMALSRWLKR